MILPICLNTNAARSGTDGSVTACVSSFRVLTDQQASHHPTTVNVCSNHPLRAANEDQAGLRTKPSRANRDVAVKLVQYREQNAELREGWVSPPLKSAAPPAWPIAMETGDWLQNQ